MSDMKVNYVIDLCELQQIMKLANVSKGLANHFAKRIRLGEYKEGEKLASFAEISRVTTINKYKIRKAFDLLREWKLVVVRHRRNSVVRAPDTSAPITQTANAQFNVNYNLKISHKFVMPLELRYRQLKYEYRDSNLPVQHWGDYPPLRKTISKFLHKKYGVFYPADQIYYHSNFSIILRVLAEIMGKCGCAFAIPRGHLKLRKLVEVAGVEILDFNVDEQGMVTSELEQICKQHQITAVFLMSRANYPDTTYTTAQRIGELFALQQKHGFKVIDICGYEPLVTGDTYPLVKLAGAAIDAVVCLQPVSYIVEEMNETFIVAAAPDLIRKVQEKDEVVFGKKCRLKAYATHKILIAPQYKKTFRMVLYDIRLVRAAVNKTFCKSGWWKPEGLGDQGGVALYLEPLQGNFPDDVFEMLPKLNIQVVDPHSYWLAGTQVKGVRIDLSLYIGNKELMKVLTQLNSRLQSLVINSV